MSNCCDSFVSDPVDWKVFRKTALTKAIQMDNDFEVRTPEGVMKGKKGDYLCTDMKQKHRWPVKKEIFENTYQHVPPGQVGHQVTVLSKQTREVK